MKAYFNFRYGSVERMEEPESRTKNLAGVGQPFQAQP